VLSRVTVSREMPETIPEQPAVRIVDGATGPRPAVSGTGLDVWEIVETVAENGGSLSEAAAYLEVHPEVVETAMRYYRSHSTEIDSWIENVREASEQAQAAWKRGRRIL
jgi:uncharacterized protein (DUF433 family)